MMEKPQNLYEMSLILSTARKVLTNLYECGTLALDDCKDKYKRVYCTAAYRLLMMDDIALQCWMAAPLNTKWRYSDFEYDKKGKMIKCKATLI